MGWKNNKDTIVTNLVQQSSSILIFLTVPNFLEVEGYAQVVFISTLLAFMTFSDFGLSFVYGRRMPAVFAAGDAVEIQRWNDTVFTFRIGTALFFGAIIGMVYFLKYQEPQNALLLCFIPLLSVIAAFFVAQHTAMSGFATYRKVNSFQSLVRLLIIPGAMLAGLLGWFIAQLLAGLLTFTKIYRMGGLPQRLRIDVSLLNNHFAEGVLLGIVTTLWAQLLASGKVFASFIYEDVEIAQYGLLNTGYQIIASLVIAAFIPQTVKVYRMIEVNTQEAIAYTLRVILYAIPVVFILAVISREVTPFILATLFREYPLDLMILDSLIFSLAFYPIIVTLGSILIAKKKSILYLLLITAVLVFDWIMVLLLEADFGFRSAAIAQFASLAIYSLSLLILVLFLFKDDIHDKFSQLIKICGSLAGLFSIYITLH